MNQTCNVPVPVVTVFNLLTGEYGSTYVGISPAEAVVAAHAQSLGDYNTWDYTEKYGHLIRHNGDHVLCGVFTAQA